MNSKPPTPPNNPTKRIAIAIDLDQVVPWHYDCCEGILSYGQSRGWACSIDPLFLDYGLAGGGAGLYDGVVGRIGGEVAQAALAQGIPAVNHWMNSPAKDLPSIAIDSRAGGQMVGEHLVACGYRSLGYVDSDAIEGGIPVVEGLARAAAGAGLGPPVLRKFDLASVFTEDRATLGRFLDELDRWLTGLTTPIGLYVGDVTVARYVAQRCKRLGLSVPGDVGIVAWNDNACATAVSPTLSVIEHDWVKVGYEAAKLLDELMQGKKVHPQQRVVAPERITQRDSTDVFLCEDELVKAAMQYIAEHCRQELKVKEVAEALHVSDRTLYRRFDEALGRPIKDEIKRLRIDRLKLMVQETSLSLGEIAQSFEFSSAGQFTRYFSKAVGMPPSAYRKKYGDKGEG